MISILFFSSAHRSIGSSPSALRSASHGGPVPPPLLAGSHSGPRAPSVSPHAEITTQRCCPHARSAEKKPAPRARTRAPAPPALAPISHPYCMHRGGSHRRRVGAPAPRRLRAPVSVHVSAEAEQRPQMQLATAPSRLMHTPRAVRVHRSGPRGVPGPSARAPRRRTAIPATPSGPLPAAHQPPHVHRAGLPGQQPARPQLACRRHAPAARREADRCRWTSPDARLAHI